MRIHAIQTGHLVGNESFWRGSSPAGALRRARLFEFPVHCFLLEHREGPILVDTGMTTSGGSPRWQRRFAPSPVVSAAQELGPQLRARGVDPADIPRVVVTHLDWDHVGGVGHVPDAEVLVHRPEWKFAQTRIGRARFRPGKWPDGFRPTLVDLDDGPCGPFPASRAVTAAGDVRLVPLPGHSPGQVGVVARAGAVTLLFCADHVMSEAWFREDEAAGREVGLGQFAPRQAAATTRLLRRFMAETPTVLVPAHDPEAPARLRAAGLADAVGEPATA